MYTFFYPETNERLYPVGEHEYPTKQEAFDFWKSANPCGWADISFSETSFMHQTTGEIVVIRKI